MQLLKDDATRYDCCPMNTQAPRRIFVSHIHEEAALASAVKEGLEDAFAGRVAVFVSSDKRDNPGGDEWSEKVRRELQDPLTCMLISLISPTSLKRPWISIELGAAWARNLALFPLCHSGSSPGNLPRPLGDFGGATLDSDEAAERLISASENAVGHKVSRRWPRADLLTDIRAAANQSTTESTPERAPVLRALESNRPSEQIIILQLLSQLQDQHIEDIDCHDGARAVSMSPSVFLYHVTKLVQERLARDSFYMDERHYSITPDGVGWLIENGQMPMK
jgi:hypothetical protein